MTFGGSAADADVRAAPAPGIPQGALGADAEFGAGLVNARAAVAGLGSGGTGSPGPAHQPLEPFVRVKRKQQARTILRRGIRLRVRLCRPAARACA